MSELGDILRARASTKINTDVEPPTDATTERKFSWSQRGPVRGSPDLDRVIALPRRTLSVSDEDVSRLHQHLRRPGSSMALRPIQARALVAADEAQGLLGQVAVGEGKTLLALLLPTMLKAKRTVLLIKPDLRAQLFQMYEQYAQHWHLPNLYGASTVFPGTEAIIHAVAYSELSSPRRAGILELLQPDLIVCDEAQQLRHPSAARTKRFLRFFKAHPSTKLCALSGTLVSKSLEDFAHLAKLALGHGAPVPLDWRVIQEWAGALDPGDFRSDPGQLRKLCIEGEDARQGFHRRLIETPGVVATSSERPAMSLEIHERPVDVPEVVRKHLKTLAETWCTPGGEEIVDALSYHRASTQLACGFYYRWTWPRGETLEVRKEWLEARREIHREMRDVLKTSVEGMDSPFLCAMAAARYWAVRRKFEAKPRSKPWPALLKRLGRRRRYWASQTWERWAEIKHQARPSTEAVWVDDFLIRDALAWSASVPAGIVWYEHDAVGRRLAADGGLPLFAGGEDASTDILREDGTRVIVASSRAHGTGKNLQAFSTQLITTISSSGQTCEQLLGRTHRSGQNADEVSCYIYLHTPELRKALASAQRDAEFIEQTWGSVQKLRYASYNVSNPSSGED